MKCSSCGTEIESGAARCPNCGAAGDSASGAVVRLKTNRSILLYVIFGMVPVVMVISSFVYVILKLSF